MRPIAFILALWIAALPATAEVARPETLLDTLRVMQNAFLALETVETAEIDLADQSIKVTGTNGQEVQSFPDNLHKVLQGAETDLERQDMLDNFVAGLAASVIEDQDAAKDPSTIVPLVRPASFVTSTQANTAPVSIPFVGDMRIFYAFDNPTTLAYVSPDEARDLGLDPEALGDLAARNFARRNWQPEILGDGIYYLEFDGTFEASFLLTNDLWEQVDDQLGQIVMMALARDLIVFTDAEWDGAEAALRDLAAGLKDDLSYPLSDLVYEWRDGGWQVRP